MIKFFTSFMVIYLPYFYMKKNYFIVDKYGKILTIFFIFFINKNIDSIYNP